MIVNVATVKSQDLPPEGVQSNAATIVVRVPSPATIELLEYAPRSPRAQREAMVQGAYRPGADQSAPFVPLPPPHRTGAVAPIDLSQPVPLLGTAWYHQGDSAFIRVTARDQNVDRTARDTIQVTLTDDLTGDTEIVRLTEDGPDTGVFVGYVPTMRTSARAGRLFDGSLEVIEQSRLSARFVDDFSGVVVSAAAVVDPISTVFDSRTGKPVSGAVITVVDVASGQPAAVFSDDGLTSFPSSLTAGQSATDGGGRVHTFAPGSFRFPFLPPGTYRYDVKPPASYLAPSKATDDALSALPGGPFAVVTPGSRGEAFTLDNEPARHIDLPVDPQSTPLWVTKSANREVAGPGDAIAYEIDVTNSGTLAAAAATTAIDRLPTGFRYQRGTAQLNGAPAADPQIGSDGQTLAFALGDLAPGATAQVRFLVVVGAAVKAGSVAINLASAAGANGSASNLAQAAVRISDDFFDARSFVMGRVSTGDCREPEGEGDKGVPGARIVLEDGTFVVSDSKGLYHFEGLRPGLHVVQLDLDSVPEGWEPVACTRNDRFAGRSFSQFVDLSGRTLWRADFHVRAKPKPPPPPAPPPPPPPPGEVTLSLSHEVDKLIATFDLELQGTRAPLPDAKVTVNIPASFTYEPGSTALDGAPVADPSVSGTTLTWTLGSVPAEWTRKLTFRARATDDAPPGPAPVTATLLGGGGGTPLDAVSADNAVEVRRELWHKPVSLVLRPHFPSFGTSLGEADRKQLDAMAKQLLKTEPDHIVVSGHTDAQRISKRGQKLYRDNAALSLARARTVGAYLLQVLKLGHTKLQAEGKGESEPLASNDSAAGRATNRRVEVSVFTKYTTEITVLRAVKNRSGPVVAKLRAPAPVQSAPSGGAVYARYAPGSVPSAAGGTPGATALTGESPSTNPNLVAVPPVAAAKPAPDGFQGPHDGDLLPDRIGAVQIRAASYLTLHFSVDGKEVDANRIGYKSDDAATGKTTLTWVGVDFGERGPHTLLVTGTDPFGNERLHQEAHVVRTGEIAQLRFRSADGNVADGRTPVHARLELLDAQGQVIHGAVRLELREGNLARLRREGENVTLDEAVGRTVQMDRDGNVLFAPVNTSGSYRAVLAAGNATAEVETWAQPKMRDWILVGLAEGTAGYTTISGNTESAGEAGADQNLYENGRVAFYAKGQVQRKWLVTAAYDSAKQVQVGTSLFQQIDPQTYFTVYADATQQQYDAASQRKVYVKIERDQFYALFGDYDTGLTVTELSRFSRRMNGVKAELNTRHVEVNGFAARTAQTYAHDEIPGDGTSGLYHLSRRGILLNSETITLLVRDRFRSEVIVSSRTLTRFIDYSIDYDAGTIFFREPVLSRDDQLNPQTIVAEYETTGAGAEDYTLGGRAGLKLLDNRVRAGVTAVHQGEGDVKSDLYGADARFQVSEATRLRGEVATTSTRDAGATSNGTAFLGEVAHTTRLVDARAYFREQQSAFGLGQQAFSESGTRKWGGDATVHLTQEWAVNGQAFRQDTFATGMRRLFAEARATWTRGGFGAHAGLLDADDRLVDGTTQSSGQLTAGGKVTLLRDRLILGLDYAQSVWGNGSVDFPTRLGAHAEYKLTQDVSLVTADEVTFGSTATTNTERLGLRAAPWKGGTFTAGVERDLNENANRVFGNIGLRQMFQLSPEWKIDGGLERSQTLREASFYQPNPSFPPASGAVSENFTAATAGANYQVKNLVWDSRVEGRTAQSGDKWSLLSGIVADRGGGWALSGRGQLFGTRGADGSHTTSADLRFGLAYRPPLTHWIVLNRLDWLIDRQSGVAQPTDAWRLVDNFLANWRPRKELQVSFGYGAKYGRAVEAGGSYAGYTDETGLELRYDLREMFDVGLRGSVLHVWGEKQFAYSAGPEVGVSPATNVWVSVGFNVVGYEDHDFTAAGFQARGAYLRLRFKFDQESVREAAAFLNKQ